VNATPIIEADGTLSQVYTIFQDITAEKKAKQDYQLLFDSMADGFALHEIICDRLGNPVDYRFLAVNPAFERIVEKKASDIIGKTVREVFPDIEPYWIQTYGKVALTGKSVMFESYAAPTGKHFRVTAYQPAPMQFACTFSDDTLRVESEKKYSSYIENAPYAVTVVDENGNFLESNKAASIITGYSREQLMSMNIRDISAAKCLKEAADHFELLLKKGKMSAELKYRHNDGSVRWWAVDAVKLSDNRFLVFSIDITDRKQAEEELINLNQRDYLTGIYNRRYFETELKRMDEDNILPLSVIIADINGVKIINDAFGHTAGDKHIIETASILKSCCRSGDVLARIGGDEFAILMPNTDHNAASEVLRNIQAALGEFDAVNSGNAYQHSVSLGCATKVSANDDMKEIIKVAEGYMYQRKLLEHNSVHSTIVSSIKATMFEKSHETEEHAQRLVALSKAVGIALDLPQAELDKLELLASLHDIGKVGVRDDILTKPGELNEMEWAEIKRHPEIGYRIAKTTPELAPIAEGILCHHEYWDGSGYPQGLSGESIPLLSRIVAVADAYDAMVNDRPYRKALDHNEAINRIKQKAGVQFDPHIVNIFIEKVPDHSYYV
jgi:diguanylate cyclase (GGDEF)-like protein/PAS domain S-box-containing protein